MKHQSIIAAAIWLAVSASLETAVAAQSVSVVYNFTEIPKRPTGRLVPVADGLLYGVSAEGGAHSKGAVFALYKTPTGKWAASVIHSFMGSDGANPTSIMRASDGNFYGTTLRGGVENLGTIFKMTPSRQFTTLYLFPGPYPGPQGASPIAALVEATDGDLWGMTLWGGQGGGTIFRMTPLGSLTTVHSFNGSDGSQPTAALIQATDGDFYGTAPYGGPQSGGTAFRITATGVLTTLHYFGVVGTGDPASHPSGPLVQGSDGNFYGTTNFSQGTVFKMTRDGEVTLIHVFEPSGSEGFGPTGGLTIGTDQWFYGTTEQGSENTPEFFGTAFRVNAAGQFEKLATLGGPLGQGTGAPFGLPDLRLSGLIQMSDGLLYGTTPNGGLTDPSGQLAGYGAAFTVAPSGGATLLYQFSSDKPLNPIGRLVVGAAGELIGTSCRGGWFNQGTVFKLTGTGVTTLHSFYGPDGACPTSGVTVAPDGTLYGTTFTTGARAKNYGTVGTVFKITPTGEFTTLHSFTADSCALEGCFPFGGVTFGSDHQLYGTASGWRRNYGTLFRVSPSGDFSIVHNFYEGGGGHGPFASLVPATDGNLYGTTLYGLNSLAEGNVFRVTPNGDVTNLATIPGRPYSGGLVQGRDGHLYGAAVGGVTGRGILFKATLSGNVSVLHAFDGSDGLNPLGALHELGTGEFLGVTFGLASISDKQYGTLYRVKPDGTFVTFHRFSWLDGANPFVGLTQASEGLLYGTTYSGGLGGGGVIFRVSLPKAQ